MRIIFKLFIIIGFVYSTLYAGGLFEDLFIQKKELAMQGDTDALESVGYSYANGLGCPKSIVEAYAYYSVAGSKGGMFAAWGGLTTMEKNMTPQVLAEAQRRSIELDRQIQENINKAAAPNKEKEKTPEELREQIRQEERAKLAKELEREQIRREEKEKAAKEQEEKAVKEKAKKTTWQKLQDVFK